MLDHFFFYVGFCFLLTHEMDAVRCQEWQILPFLSRLNDEAGYRAFTILHVPLYVLLLWFLWRSDGSNRNLMVGLDVFFTVHTFLHILLRNLPRNQFKTLFSWIHIAGAGIAGVIDLLFYSFSDNVFSAFNRESPQTLR